MFVPAPATQPPGQPIPSIRETVQLAQLGEQEHFAAVLQSLDVLDIDFCIRIVCLDALFDRAGNAAGYRIAAAGARRVVHAGMVLDRFGIDALRLEHSGKLFKGDDEVDVAADSAAGRLQFFRSARPDEYDARIRIFLLDGARRGRPWESACATRYLRVIRGSSA